jgi:Family of unknown function (DUF6953)
MSDTTPEAIAQWMLGQLEQQPELYQIDAVDGIAKNFGTEFTPENRNGRPAIDKRVLKAFNELTAATVVWDHWGRYWRKRQPSDPPGREVR